MRGVQSPSQLIGALKAADDGHGTQALVFLILTSKTMSAPDCVLLADYLSCRKLIDFDGKPADPHRFIEALNHGEASKVFMTELAEWLSQHAIGKQGHRRKTAIYEHNLTNRLIVARDAVNALEETGVERLAAINQIATAHDIPFQNLREMCGGKNRFADRLKKRRTAAAKRYPPKSRRSA